MKLMHCASLTSTFNRLSSNTYFHRKRAEHSLLRDRCDAMAAIIGDFVPDLSRFHDMIANPSSRQAQRQHESPPQRQRSSTRLQAHDSPRRRSSSRPRASASTPRSPRREETDTAKTCQKSPRAAQSASPADGRVRKSPSVADSSSKFPSPPPSSSPTVATAIPTANDENCASMAPQTGDAVSAARQPVHGDSSSVNTMGRNQQPSPPSSASQIPDSSASSSAYTGTNADANSTQQTSQDSHQSVIHVRDLAHVQALVEANTLGGASGSADASQQIKYEISAMPIADVIEMVAALLTKITTTNDLQHDAMQRNVAHQQQANQSSDSGSHMSPLSHSVLAFHGKNVPAITILSYLSRIHKYCPTTYEVFLSLLVYFDRMTERVNDLVMKSEQSRSRAASRSEPTQPRRGSGEQDTTMRDHGSGSHESDESDSDLADDDDDDDHMVDSPTATGRDQGGRVLNTPEDRQATQGPATYFVVDSFNIHRLIISGVTCASKFFSDVFYTNSRYAKVREHHEFVWNQTHILTDYVC